MMRALLLLLLGGYLSLHAAPAELRLSGDWDVQVTVPGSTRSSGKSAPPRSATLHVYPPLLVTVTAELYESLPLFNTNAGGWVKGAQLRGLRAQETTTPFLLEPSSLVLRTGPTSEAETLEPDKDYTFDKDWGTVGRIPGSRIAEGQKVYASYRHAQLRLDSVVLTRKGRIQLRQGEPQAAAPCPPTVAKDEKLLANIWLPGRINKLSSEHLFPVLETSYPEPVKPFPSVAEVLLPKTLAKLRSQQPVRILAWGDSVTDGSYVPDPARNRWQEQFVARLRAAYPQAKVELVTEAWGGRNTSSYLAEPPGSPHNYREKVLGAKPDLIVSEFVNDAWMNSEQVEQQYGKLLADLQGIAAEWIILTPHYVRPDWMGISRERDIDQDPRPYVAGLRQFTARHQVALADASLRYGRLWRQGIPYSTLMLNSINHPDARGMKLFADALMELWP
jgi:lysophospholipase L1-like esterase